MVWTELRIGKHKGKTLPQILFVDPDWFFWAFEEGSIFKGMLVREAALIHRRATAIRIPANEKGEEMVAEYMIDPTVGKFAGVEVIPKSRPKHEGSTRTFRMSVLDMSAPRRIAQYDKLGGKLLVETLKQIFFGSSRKRMTKEACEAFFNDSSNFSIHGM